MCRMAEGGAERAAEDSERDDSQALALSSDEIVERKGYSTSVVWRWFGYQQNDVEQIKPVCKVCRRSVPSKTGNTTNLFNHLKKHHPSDYSESAPFTATSHPRSSTATTSPAPTGPGPRQQSIVSSFAAITLYEHNSKRKKAITKAITYCLAKDMMPLSSVEKDGFKYLMKVLDPRYEIPGRKYFSQTAMPQL